MVIKESQMISTNRASNILNELSYLDESSAQYHAAMVPVVENSALEGYIVRLEDMVSFAEANGIEDLGYALSLVCEASEIEPSNVVFSVQAESILLDEEMEQLATDIANEGVAIVGVHASSSNPVCQVVDTAVNYLIESGDTSLLEAVVNEEWEVFDEEEEKKEEAPKTKNDIERELRDKRGETALARRAKTLEKGTMVVQGKEGTEEKKIGAVRSIMEKVKSGAYHSRNALAKVLDRLNAWARNIQDKMNEDPTKKGVFAKIKAAIVQAIEVVSRKLHNTVEHRRGEIEDRGKQFKTEPGKQALLPAPAAAAK